MQPNDEERQADPDDSIMPRRQSLGSGSWIALQQLVVLGCTALSGILVARTVSVDDFGIFSFATGLATIGGAAMSAGLSGLAVKCLVEAGARAGRTVATVFAIRECFAVFTVLLLGITAHIVGPDGQHLLVGIALGVLLFRSLDVTEYWFQSRARSRPAALVRIAGSLIFLAVRAALANAGADLRTFLFLYLAEACTVSVALLIVYLASPGRPRLERPDLHQARLLLGRSWILMLSGLAAQVNSRGDLILLQSLVGPAAVGIYAAGARLSELLYFLPNVLMIGLFPRLLQIRRIHGHTSVGYKRELQTAYDVAFWAGLTFALGVFALGPTALKILYGEQYAAAGDVLRIHVLALPFVFMAAVYSKWIIAEGILWASLMRHALGAALNVALNLWLIPREGVTGAALATVCSYVLASYAACFVSKRSRVAAFQMTAAVAAPVRLLLQRRRGSMRA